MTRKNQQKAAKIAALRKIILSLEDANFQAGIQEMMMDDLGADLDDNGDKELQALIDDVVTAIDSSVHQITTSIEKQLAKLEK